MASNPEPRFEKETDTKKLKIETPKQPELASHDSTVLDLAFVMDCTGSMSSYIQNATEVFPHY